MNNGNCASVQNNFLQNKLQTDFLLQLESTLLHITRMTDKPVFRQIVKGVNARRAEIIFE